MYNTCMKVLTLNIEGDNHFERVLPFLQTENADVVCLQEVFKADLPAIQEALQSKAEFFPLATVTSDNNVRLTPNGEWGIAIFTQHPIQHASHHLYFQPSTQLPELDDTQPNSVRRVLLTIDIAIDGMPWRVSNTHFTWSPGGKVTQEQQRDLKTLLDILAQLQPDVICGDFNSPRGSEIYDTLAAEYSDSVPTTISTTIDQELHRVSGIQFVVDSIFLDKKFSLLSSKVVGGVSDHQSVVVEVQ